MGQSAGSRMPQPFRPSPPPIARTVRAMTAWRLRLTNRPSPAPDASSWCPSLRPANSPVLSEHTTACTRRRAPFRSRGWFARSNLGSLLIVRVGNSVRPSHLFDHDRDYDYLVRTLRLCLGEPAVLG